MSAPTAARLPYQGCMAPPLTSYCCPSSRGAERLADVGFDDLRMRDHIERLALVELLTEVEHEDMLGQLQNDVHEVLDHENRDTAGVNALQQSHQLSDVALRGPGHHFV